MCVCIYIYLRGIVEPAVDICVYRDGGHDGVVIRLVATDSGIITHVV
jgi:hypothetical protein